MVHVGLSKMDLSKVKPKSREEHRKTLDRWFESQRELERICKEQGIPVPVMVCGGNNVGSV